jgi:hypothetical protein
MDQSSANIVQNAITPTTADPGMQQLLCSTCTGTRPACPQSLEEASDVSLTSSRDAKPQVLAQLCARDTCAERGQWHTNGMDVCVLIRQISCIGYRAMCTELSRLGGACYTDALCCSTWSLMNVQDRKQCAELRQAWVISGYGTKYA